MFSDGPLNTDTRIIRTLRHVPLVSVLTGFHCTFIYRTNLLFASKEPSKVPPGRPKEGPKEPAWKKEVREAREKRLQTEPEKVCMGMKDITLLKNA